MSALIFGFHYLDDKRHNLMKIKDLSTYKPDEIKALLARIPFYKELSQIPNSQLEKLLNVSCIVELDPGETIMRRGDKGSWLYFLIKGRLDVYLSGDAECAPLNHITPGELFGDLALLCDHERKATVTAEPGHKPALLFATDFKVFGDLTNFNTVDLETKLIFYRTMIHSIRWRLEVKRMDDLSHPLVQELKKVPLFNGERGSEKELAALHQQAQFLANLLDRWNSEGMTIEDVVIANAANQG